MFALVLTVVLIVVNIIVLPRFGNPDTYAATFADLVPLALVAVASTPAMMSGPGGIDVSVGPIAGLIGIIYVVYLQPHGMGGPLLAIPIALLIGAGIGVVNGVLIAKFRYQPVIATLCMYFIIGGFSEEILPTPRATNGWMTDLVGSIGPIPGGLVMLGVPLVIWALILRWSAFIRTLRAIGGNSIAAYTAGVDVTTARIVAYALGGFFAAIAGFSLIAVTRNADPALGAQYTILAFAAVSVGGTVFGGGRGGIVGAVLGAACIYLIENLLTNVNASSYWAQVAYGAVLVIAMVYSSRYVPKSADQEMFA
jgi:ribose transport system permease protein